MTSMGMTFVLGAMKMLRYINYITIKLSVELFFNMLNYLLNLYKGRYMHLNIFLHTFWSYRYPNPCITN